METAGVITSYSFSGSGWRDQTCAVNRRNSTVLIGVRPTTVTMCRTPNCDLQKGIRLLFLVHHLPFKNLIRHYQPDKIYSRRQTF